MKSDLKDLKPAPVFPPVPPEIHEAIKGSILKNGVLEPILITPDLTIIDGHTRYQICREIGLKKSPYRVVNVSGEAERIELAISLNADRRTISREERRQLLEHLVRVAPEKSSREVADVCHVSQSTANRARQRVLEGESDDSRVVVGRDGKRYRPRPTTVGVESLPAAREAARLLRSLGDQAPEGNQSIRIIRKAEFQARCRAEADSPVAQLPPEIQIVEGDFRALEAQVGDLSGRVDLLFCDPPWIKEYRHLLGPFGEMAGRLLRPGGILLTYTIQSAIPEFLDAIQPHLEYQWAMSAVNYDSKPAEGKITQNHGQSKINGGCVIVGWRPLLLFSKGKLATPHQVHDLVFNTEKERPIHPERWQQPLSEACYYVRALSRAGDLIVDLFAGVGTSALAAAQVGQGRRFIGCDINPICVQMARSRVAGADAGRPATPSDEAGTDQSHPLAG